MKAHIIVLLLGLVSVASPAMAEQHTSAAATTNEDIDDEDIGDDAGLITDEFSYTYLFDQSYGALAGFGKSSPRLLMQVEGLAFLLDKLALSMLIGYAMEQKYRHNNLEQTADTLSLGIKARYYLPMMPLSVNSSCGFVFWSGETKSSEGEDTYKNYETYLDMSLSAYYFWKNGIYIETVIYGIGFGKAFGVKSDKHKTAITKTVEEVEHFGIFGDSSINLTVGYMF